MADSRSETVFLRLGASVMAIAGALIAAPALAQDEQLQAEAGSASASDGAIIVTARRREEALHDVPVAVSVVSGKSIEAAGIRRVTDLTALVPNLSINSGYRQGSLWISLRGVPSVQGGEPPVTVLIDGVQVPGQDFINEELNDIQSVQVLRGPQGAIYGRGAIGGAILIDTNRPTNDFTGKADLLVGRHNDVRATGVISGPLIQDRVFARLSVLARRTDGLQPNFTTGDYADAGHGFNVGARLLFDLGNGFTIDLNGRHQHGKDGASYEYLVTDANRYDYDTVGTVNDPNVTDNHTINDISAKIEKVFPGVTLTSITQYARSSSKVFGDTDFTAEHIVLQNNRVTMKAVNEDLRIASNGSGALSWMVGGFFQSREVVNSLLVFGDPKGPTPGVVSQDSDQHDKSLAWAVYGQATAKLPAGFELSGAIRYDSDQRKSFDPLQTDTFVRKTFTSVQPQVTLKKVVTDNINIYGTVGKGFRSGGFNPYADTITLGVSRLYKPETSTNYEVGVKTKWLDGRLTLNATYYHTDFKNQQLFFISVTPVARDIYNIDRTKIDGGELELNYRPASDLTVSASLGISDSRISRFAAAPAVSGNRSPMSYSETGNVSVSYTPKISEKTGLIFYADWDHRGKIYWDAQNDYKTGSADTFNGRIGLSYNSLELSFYMRNITDKRFPVLFQANAAGSGVHGQLLNMPRTYGIEVKASF
ncbi:TonB-dependent receptor [Flavisphingomonas formosensis]|uniref:TonB-dependent receptor n=1 Tax=Flavisphingomonas formosensis TaxID=861534 RepID=UPI0018DF8A1C|nr:TonB-dependent receptor [Sphingomonas formosensis]